MRATRVDYSGRVYGKLTVTTLNPAESGIRGRNIWNLLCECGTLIVKSSSDIGKLVDASSCWCYKKPKTVRPEKHLVVRPHKTTLSEYSSWEAMRQRCNNPNHANYSYYGGRGIAITPEWDDFWQFYADVGPKPEGYTLERVDPNIGYEPNNCKWETRSVQAYNTRVQCNNTSGVTGVVWSERDKRWSARIDVRGVPMYLGSSFSFDVACKLRKEAELKYFGIEKPVGERLREVGEDGEARD